MTSDQVTAIHNLRPAIRNGREMWVGKLGQTHAQIPHKPGTVGKGFVDLHEGRFLSLTQAGRLIAIPGLESLDSQALSRLQQENPQKK